ncbi:MAG: hypothetical protein ACYCPR_09085 [Thermoplasmataceae archaeon]
MLKLMGLNSNPAYSLSSLIHYGFLSILWTNSILFLISLLIIFSFSFRDKKMIFILSIIFITILIGSGYESPISSFNVYLYTHFPGFQFLNDSYMWEWAAVSPLISLLLGLTVEHLYHGFSYIKINTNLNDYHKRDQNLSIKLNKIFHKPVYYLVIFLSIFIITVPLATLSYYGPNGIHSSKLQSNYGEIVDELHKLVGNTSYGVAIFPPYFGITFNDENGGSINPLFLNPYYRVATPQQYSTTPSGSNHYFYWLYNLFYSNITNNISELFGMMDVKYFVTLNGVDNQSSLATNLMLNQRDVRVVYSTANYSIFENTLPMTFGGNVKSLAIFPGSYDALSLAANLGVNLSTMPIIFTSDINSSNYEALLNKTSTVFIQDNSSLTSLAIDRYLNESNTVMASDLINNYAYNISSNWVRNSILYEFPQIIPYRFLTNKPFNFIDTSSHQTLNLTFRVPHSGSYSLWLHVINSPISNSTIDVSINGDHNSIQTNVPNQIGSFSWIKESFNASSKGKVSVSISPSGFNALSEVVLLKKGLVSQEIFNLSNLFKFGKLNYVYLNSSINERTMNLVSRVNQAATFSNNISISNYPNSYAVTGNSGGYLMVKENYYYSMIPLGIKGKEIPTIGGASFILLSTSTRNTIVFQASDYYPFITGIYSFLSSISVCLIVASFLPEVITRREKNKNELDR